MLRSLTILTLFPDLFRGFLDASLVGKAREQNLVEINLVNIRDFADPPHYKTDDSPYGGGAGMVMKPEPLDKAFTKIKSGAPNAHCIFLTPSGSPLTQKKVKEFSQHQDLIVLCGRYEGVDQRVIDKHVQSEISIGDYVIMGGEVAAMVLTEACLRYIPDVLGNQESLSQESFSPEYGDGQLVEAPHYTRPEIFDGKAVPEVLLSGNHKEIDKWRLEQSQLKTSRVRK